MFRLYHGQEDASMVLALPVDLTFLPRTVPLAPRPLPGLQFSRRGRAPT